MKSDNRKKVGLLQPIPIPSRKWECITTDLVMKLPSSVVFVDRLTKMIHFSPCTKEINADQLFCGQCISTTRHASGNYLRLGSKVHQPVQFSQILGIDLRLGTAFHP